VLLTFIDFQLNRVIHLVSTNSVEVLKLVVELVKIQTAQLAIRSEVPGRAIRMARSRSGGA
jgi:hypothetical protein